jgi:hypothetical protein
MRPRLSFAAFGLAIALGIQCSLLASPLSNAFADELWITPVDPLPRPAGNDLTAGAPVPLKVTVKYALTSTDHASLAVFAEEFPYTAGGCTGTVHTTNGGTNTIIQRGSGTIQTTIIWNGNTPVYPKGYITLGANWWTADGSKLIGGIGLVSAICYHFFPPGGHKID